MQHKLQALCRQLMEIEQKKWTQSQGWKLSSSKPMKKKAQLVFAFGDRFILSEPSSFEELKKFYPQANIVLCSTSGNIQGTGVDDHSIVSTALAFDQDSQVQLEKVNITEVETSFKAGENLGKRLSKEGLKHVFLVSDGHLVNGSELVKGIYSVLPPQIHVTGGLAGDGTRFEKTVVGLDSYPSEGEIVAIGFYGSALVFGFGSIGGWDSFGIERKITRSKGNVLYELDGKSALELYKNYLGEQAAELPGSALLFPLAIRQDKNSPPIVRTILSINEENQSMVFAGDIPTGWYAQLMKANFDHLIDGASKAALASYEMLGSDSPDLALLVSCVGRRLVLDQRSEEELESVQDVIQKNAVMTGFYSYGEIAPTSLKTGCELHNQTMTITTISEK